MSTANALQTTRTSTVTPDQIDELGHMNVRWYGHNAVKATQAFCADLGLDRPGLRSAYTRHHNEQLVDSKLEVQSGVLEMGPNLHLYHELRNSADGQLAATFVHELDIPRLDAPTVEMPPHGTPRSLRLSTDALEDAPTLQDLRDRNLEMRLPRDVTTEDSLGAHVVPSWLTNNLIWGGERLPGEHEWIRTGPNGERIAFATMESRTWIGTPTPIGTRIQSFSAVVAIQDKISHSISWAIDLTTEKPVAAFEVINLCFNLNTRQSLVMPDMIRDRESSRFHPELAPVDP